MGYYGVHIGMMEKNMETTIVCIGLCMYGGIESGNYYMLVI